VPTPKGVSDLVNEHVGEIVVVGAADRPQIAALLSGPRDLDNYAPCFVRVVAASCSSSARWAVDRESEQLAASPFVGRLSFLVKFSLQLRSCTPASALGPHFSCARRNTAKSCPPSSPLARFDLSLSTAR
jgi:hypothetical protein